MHSQYEPGGRVVLEALGAGLPVIATPFGFAREFVRDWVSGFIVDYGDVRLRPCDVLHTRTFTPTYPFSRAIDDGTVADLVRSVRLDFRTFPRRVNGVQQWEVTDGTDAWVLKQVQPRFEVRPLWDRHVPFDSLRTAEDRLAAARVASNHAPFIPVTVVSEPHRLVMQPVDRPVVRGAPELTSLARTLRMLWSSEVPELSAALADSRPHRTFDSVVEVVVSLRRLGREIHPVFRCSTIAPELGWRLRLLRPDLSERGLWAASDIEAAQVFADLATQVRPRVVVTHRHADMNAFMMWNGTPGLVSGEDLECAVIGKDHACLLLGTLGESDVAGAMAILGGCGWEEERLAILTWTGLLAFEGVCRNAALRRVARLAFYRRLWSEATMLLRQVTP